MITPLAALHLLVLAQVAPPTLVTPEEAAGPDATVAASSAPPAAEAPPPAAPAPAATPAAPAAKPAAAAKAPERPAIPSIQSAEPLRGTTAVFAWGGWSSFGAAWVSGLTAVDDLGATLDFDWAKTELRLGGVYRHPFGAAGAWDSAGRIGLSWYANYGSSWVYSGNHADRGLEVSPALVLSRRGGGGVFSLAGELPMVVTFRNDSGFLFTPRLAGAYELPLVEGMTVGARASIGYRAGAGDAPLKEGRGELQFLVLAGWQLL
jgi:hypothetical protein